MFVINSSFVILAIPQYSLSLDTLKMPLFNIPGIYYCVRQKTERALNHRVYNASLVSPTLWLIYYS